MNVQELINILSQYSNSTEVLVNDNIFTINDGYNTGNHYTILDVAYCKVANGLDIPPEDPDYDSTTSYVCINLSRLIQK